MYYTGYIILSNISSDSMLLLSNMMQVVVLGTCIKDWVSLSCKLSRYLILINQSNQAFIRREAWHC